MTASTGFADPRPDAAAIAQRRWPRRHWAWLLLAALAVPLVQAQSPVPASAPTVILGAEDDAAPWSYADGTGYVNDLVRAAFEAAGWRVRLKVVPYTRCKALAIAGAVTGCFSTSRDPALDADLLFPLQPVFEARNLLVARADAGWSGCDPARWSGRPTVGLVRGYEYRREIDAQVARGFVRADFGDSEVANLRKIEAGRVAAALVTVDEVKRLDYLQRLAGVRAPLEVVCDYGALPAYVAFSRRDRNGEAARQAFDEGFERLRRRGEIAALQSDWRRRVFDAAAAKRH